MTKDQLFAFAQHITPQKTLSRAIGKIADVKTTGLKTHLLANL